MNSHLKKIGWKASGLSPDLASVRYRAILPLVALEKVGIRSCIIPTITNIELKNFDAIIIVKSFTPDDLYLAQQAKLKNIPVFFDLCDNIFIEDYRGKQTVTPAEMFITISPYLAGVIVTTSPLKLVLERILPKTIPVFVVPDGIETKHDVECAKKILKSAVKDEIRRNIRSMLVNFTSTSVSGLKMSGQKVNLAKHLIKSNIKSYLKPLTWIKKSYAVYDHARSSVTGRPRKAGKSFTLFSTDTFQASVPIKKAAIPKNIKRVLWFGNHGAKYAKFGMLDLLSIRAAIEKLNKEIPVELIVVSNNREKFLKYISRFDCVTRYIEWSADAVDAMLDIADAVVIPNSKDDFSICKSSNRTVMSINAGVPVVADMTPALEELRDAIYADDFYNGLKKCFTDYKDVKNKISLGREIIKESYGKPAIAKAFLNVFNSIEMSPPLLVPKNAVLILLHLIQDFELAKPIIEQLKHKSSAYVVWISFSLARKAPRILDYLTREKILYLCLPDDIAIINPDLFKSGHIKSLITMAETNLGPHKFTHQITNIANDAGIKTFTIQHGFENIGLTYSDSVHDIQNISMAAQKILTWGDESTFHPKLQNEIRVKIVPIGCPKPVGTKDVCETSLNDLDKKIIGVFENLHWHRYSQDYQNWFLESLMACADRYPDVVFFVKPHPAGMWLTSRFKGELPTAKNIVIADPLESKWEKCSINDFLSKLSAVISTPSTVVMDAVREDIPTLVCGFDLSLQNYQPLPIAANTQDWFTFIDDVIKKSDDVFSKANTSFIARTLIPGNAAEKIINLLLAC